MSILVVFTATVGLVFAIAGIAVFPFQPSIVSGVLCMGASLLSLAAAFTTLCCCQQKPGGAHNAALMCMVIQLMSVASLLYAGQGTSWDFCGDTTDCYYITTQVPCSDGAQEKCWEKNPYDFLRGDVPTRKRCDPKTSYFCYDRMPTDVSIDIDSNGFEAYMEDLYLSDRLESCSDFEVLDDQNINDVVSVAIEFGGPYKRNCEDYWHDCGDKSKSTAQTFWGFDDRDDCMKYYKKMGKIWPLTSTGLIMTGAVGQAIFSFLHMYYAVAATNL